MGHTGLGRMRGFVILLLLGALGCQTGTGLEMPRLPFSRMSDEEQIAAILQDVQVGMETKRIFKILAHVSPNYRDQEGRDYEALRDYLNQVFRSYRTIRITRAYPRIVVQGNQARAVDTFGTAAEPMDAAGVPPINLQGQVAVTFERDRESWKIIEWGPLR
jgi:hypothetical protein